MADNKVEELIRVDSGFTTFHAAGVRDAGGKPGVAIYLSAKSNCPADIFDGVEKLLNAHKVHTHVVRRKHVPGEADSEPEKPEGCIINIYTSKPGGEHSKVLAEVETLMKRVAGIGQEGWADALKELRDENAIAAVKEAIDGFLRGLDGGVAVLKPGKPPGPPPGKHTAELPEPKSEWAGPDAKPESKADGVLAQATKAATPPTIQ